LPNYAGSTHAYVKQEDKMKNNYEEGGNKLKKQDS